MAELAPRDVVSREIEQVMARCGRSNVWLDARHLGETYLRARFPTIWEACAEAGYDLAHDLLPVAPAAHYLVGGVQVDIDGRTSVPGLYASGEVTGSGLHGANRLASNSLLEGLVFSRRIVRALEAETPPVERTGRILAAGHTAAALDSAQVVRAYSLVRETMQRLVGMSRTDAGLAEAADVLAGLAALVGSGSERQSDLELANLVTVATLITHSAWLRTESRGCHSRLDFPGRDDAHWRVRTVLQRGARPAREPVRPPTCPPAPTTS